MKKSMLLVFVLVLAFSVALSACSKNNNATETPATTPVTTPADKTNDAAVETTSELAPYHLVLVHPGTPQADEVKIETAINAYLKDKINATIDIQAIDWGQFNDKRNLMIASKEPVDIWFTASWSNVGIDVAKGAFLDVGPLLASHGKDILASQDPAYLEGSKISGKNYGVPTSKELAEQGGIIYRKDIADELNLDMDSVKTVSDLTAIFEKVKAAKPDMTPIHLRDGDGISTHFVTKMDFMGNNDVDGAVEKNGTGTTIKSKVDFEQYTNILRIAREWYQKGLSNKDAATTQVSIDDATRAGNVFATARSLKPGKAEEIASATDMVGKLAQVTLNDATVSTGETAGSMLAISTTSKDPERAMMFINLLHSDKELNNLINFGIEGDHYTRNGEIISRTDNTGNWAHGNQWMFGSMFLNYIWDFEAPDKWEQYKVFNDTATLSPALGFTFDVEPVKSEAAAMLNVHREFNSAMESGSVDIDTTIVKYKEKMKAAGIDKVITEKQRQFDEFLASK